MPQTSEKFRFRPVIFEDIRAYTTKRFVADITAGLIVGVIGLPLAMAFAIASGVSPEAGLWTAIIAGGLIALLGGSRLQVSGPTGAFIPVVAGIVVAHGVGGLMLATLMAGVILMVMGVTGLGKMIKFIPYPVTMGFTSGIAVIIFSGQLKEFFGLQMGAVPLEFLEKVHEYWVHLPTVNWPTLALAMGTFLVLRYWPKPWARFVPAALVALLGASLVCALGGLEQWGVATIQTRFPAGIPQGLPALRLPDIDPAHWWDTVQLLVWPATTIALLGAIESLLSAVVADSMTDDRHDSNQELFAQGVGNFVAPFFGGIPATGAIARTAANIRSGATSPVAAVVHVVVLLVVVLVAAPLASRIPMAALAAILINVALNMGEWHEFLRLPKVPRSDATVFITVFGLTVFMDLTVAVGVGMVLASVLFIKRVTETSAVAALDEVETDSAVTGHIHGHHLPRGVQVFHLQGAFFFGTADKLETALRRAGQEAQAFILILDQVSLIDGTGLNALESLHERIRGRGHHLVLCAPRPNVLAVLEKSGFLQELGEENVVDSLLQAVIRVKTLAAK